MVAVAGGRRQAQGGRLHAPAGAACGLDRLAAPGAWPRRGFGLPHPAARRSGRSSLPALEADRWPRHAGLPPRSAIAQGGVEDDQELADAGGQRQLGRLAAADEALLGARPSNRFRCHRDQHVVPHSFAIRPHILRRIAEFRMTRTAPRGPRSQGCAGSPSGRQVEGGAGGDAAAVDDAAAAEGAAVAVDRGDAHQAGDLASAETPSSGSQRRRGQIVALDRLRLRVRRYACAT